MSSRKHSPKAVVYDKWLLGSFIILVALGLVMVTSASLAYAESLGYSTWHFAIRQALYVGIGLVAFMGILTVPTKLWKFLALPTLMVSTALLGVLLVPGVSREVNGSVRWLFLGPVSIQVSEFAKLSFIVFLADYLSRHVEDIKVDLKTFIQPMVILGLISGLLLLEPDFGATVVLTLTTLSILFLAGVPIQRFLVLMALALSALGALLVTSPYRLQRLTSFLDPWHDQFKSGYQLTQSLIAFGRGGWFGTGLGGSVQKLLYLPEPHTDFIYAVLAEELGLIGAMIVLILFAILVGRSFLLGHRALNQRKAFEAYIAYGIALWFGLQTLINLGVNTGVLPTKGLTLPLISYGGSSLVVGFLAIGMLFRIQFELKQLPVLSSHRKLGSPRIPKQSAKWVYGYE